MTTSTDDGLRRLTPAEFRDVIGHFASGVTVITTLYDGEPYGTTASAVSSLSLEPPMLLICMNKQSSTGQAISAARRFAVNILAEDQPDAALRFAGKGKDKFTGVKMVTGGRGEPLLRDALATLECQVVQEVTGGTHWVFLAAVERASARAGTPLAYFRGQFGRLELGHDETALREIRTRVLSREIPVSEPLDLADLAERLAVPRGSVYHALAKLAGEGLVTRDAEGAFVVAPVTFEAVQDALQSRAAIEMGVAAERAGRLKPEELAGFRRLLEEMRAVRESDEETWVRALTAFLEYGVRLAGNGTLLDAYRRINIPAIILNLRSRSLLPNLPARDVGDHAALVDAYAAGDSAAAFAAIRRRTDLAISGVRKEIVSVGGQI
jgi:flavin reductase (DIM6/NTAB) family NADH-FMN oxidoreductase RutF/DNA-binding GntR family transcriptional regulator